MTNETPKQNTLSYNDPVVLGSISVDALFNKLERPNSVSTFTPIPTFTAVPVMDTPTPTPVIETIITNNNVEGYLEKLICSYPWPCEEALYVARCESGVDDFTGLLDGQNATNGFSYGVFQLHADTHAKFILDFWEHWMIPEFNVAWAYGIWSDGGWKQWDCWK